MTKEMPKDIWVSINPHYPEKGAMYLTSSAAPRLGGCAFKYTCADQKPAQEDVREAVDRVLEFLRQRNPMRGLGDVITSAHSDENSKMANLTVSDIETIVRANYSEFPNSSNDDNVLKAIAEAKRIIASTPSPINTEYDKKICFILETLIRAATKQPEVVKDMDLIHEIYNEENEYMISMSSGDVVRYISKHYPNGIKIVEG